MFLFVPLYVYNNRHPFFRMAKATQKRVWFFLFNYMSMMIVIYFLEWQHKRGFGL
jgi:hypothetical protein